MDGERMKHKLFWIWVTAVVTCREIYCDKFTSQYARASETETNGKDPRAESCGSSLSRFGDETKPNIYYICNMNKEKKWIVYTFSCPKGTVFMKQLEKCSRLELPPISTSTSISVTKRKKPNPVSSTTTVKTTTFKSTTTTTRMPSTSKPYVIHSWSESLKEIQDLILKNANRYPSSVANTNTNKPFVVSGWKGQVPPSKVYFQEIINNPSTLSSPKPVIYNSGGISYSLVNTRLKTQTPNLSPSTTTPSNLQTTTKINLFSSADMSTTQPKVTTEPPSTTVPLSKQDELVVRDFIIKFTKPLIPFLGSPNYAFSSQPPFPYAVGVPDKEPLQAPELPSRLPSSFLPLPFQSVSKPKPKLKIKLPIPNPTNGFSVQLLERFGVKLVPEDQFFFKRKPTVQNFTSTIYSSPEEASIYEPPLILGTPVNLPNHLQPLPLPPLWFADVESRDHDETVTHPTNHFNHTTPSTTPVSRKPRV